MRVVKTDSDSCAGEEMITEKSKKKFSPSSDQRFFFFLKAHNLFICLVASAPQ